jgi:hypothetical protein
MKDSRPSPRDLTALIFQGLYPRYELATVAGIHVVTPRGTPWFAGPSLGTIARTISDYEYQGTPLHEPAGTDTGPGTAHPAPGPAA